MFVQIGGAAFAADRVVRVIINEERRIANVYLDGYEPHLIFEQERYDMFMDWWTTKAQVYVLKCEEGS